MPTLDKGLKIDASSTQILLNNRLFESPEGTLLLTINADKPTANQTITLLDPGSNAGNPAGYLKIELVHEITNTGNGDFTPGYRFVITSLGANSVVHSTEKQPYVSNSTGEVTLGVTYQAGAAATANTPVVPGSIKSAISLADVVETATGITQPFSGINASTGTQAQPLQSIGLESEFKGFISKLATYSAVYTDSQLLSAVDNPATWGQSNRLVFLDGTAINSAADRFDGSRPQIREITFGSAISTAMLNVDGVGVVINAGDSGATVASKVKTALEGSEKYKSTLEKQVIQFEDLQSSASSITFELADASVTAAPVGGLLSAQALANATYSALTASGKFFSATSGRSLINNGDGSLTATFKSTDGTAGNAAPLSFDTLSSGVRASVNTIQTYSKDTPSKKVSVSGDKVEITLQSNDQAIASVATDAGNTGVVITQANKQTYEPSQFSFASIPSGETQKIVFARGVDVSGWTNASIKVGLRVDDSSANDAHAWKTIEAAFQSPQIYTAQEAAAALAAAVNARLLQTGAATETTGPIHSLESATAIGDTLILKYKASAQDAEPVQVFFLDANNQAPTIITPFPAYLIQDNATEFASNAAPEVQTISVLGNATGSGTVSVDGHALQVTTGAADSALAANLAKLLETDGRLSVSAPEKQMVFFTSGSPAGASQDITIGGTVIPIPGGSTPSQIANLAAIAFQKYLVPATSSAIALSTDSLTLNANHVGPSAPLLLVDGAPVQIEVWEGLKPHNAANGILYLDALTGGGWSLTKADSTTPIPLDLDPASTNQTPLIKLTPLVKPTAVSFGTGTDGSKFTLSGHGLSNGTPVQVREFSGFTGSNGFKVDTTYYVVGAQTNTFQLSTTLGGSPITFTDNASTTDDKVLITNSPMYINKLQDVTADGDSVVFTFKNAAQDASALIVNTGTSGISAQPAKVVQEFDIDANGLIKLVDKTIRVEFDSSQGDVPTLSITDYLSSVAGDTGTKFSVETNQQAFSTKLATTSYTGGSQPVTPTNPTDPTVPPSRVIYTEVLAADSPLASAASRTLTLNLYVDPAHEQITTKFESIGFTVNFDAQSVLGTPKVTLPKPTGVGSSIVNPNNPGEIVIRWLDGAGFSDFSKPIATIELEQVPSGGTYSDTFNLSFRNVDLDGKNFTDGSTFASAFTESISVNRWDVKSKLVSALDATTPIGGQLVGFYSKPDVTGASIALDYAQFADKGADTASLATGEKVVTLAVQNNSSALTGSIKFSIELPSNATAADFTLSSGVTGYTLKETLKGRTLEIELTGAGSVQALTQLGTLDVTLKDAKNKTHDFDFVPGSVSVNNVAKLGQGLSFGYTETASAAVAATGSSPSLAVGEWLARDLPAGKMSQFYVATAPTNATRAVTAADALQILKLSAGFGLDWSSGTIPAAAYSAADMDADGRVTALDALIALRYATGEIPQPDPVKWQFVDTQTVNKTPTNASPVLTLREDMGLTGGPNEVVEIGAGANADYWVQAILVGNVTNPATL